MKKELDKKNKEVIILQREVEALQEVKEENKWLHDLLKIMSQKKADVIKENEELKQEKNMLNYDLRVVESQIREKVEEDKKKNEELIKSRNICIEHIKELETENGELKQENYKIGHDLKVAKKTIELERGLKEKFKMYLKEAEEELSFYKNLDMWGMKLADLYDLTQEKNSTKEQLAKQSSEAAYWKDESLRVRERLMDANDQYKELEHRLRVLECEVDQILG